MNKIKRPLVGFLKREQQGFTLIEILIVMGIMAVLATMVIIAINPARQFAQARNAQRVSNINTILNAVGQNLADNKGIFGGSLSTDICHGTTIPSTPTHIGTNGGLVNLGCLVPTYIPTMIPFDPTNGTETDTQYTISVDGFGRYSICAPNANEAALGNPGPICVTR